MHALKGGWPGCPLALAKYNESEGRKTRIRRSKEERKAMVEVFIKKYQESNKGSFPSLNLTHKEVGGSFYTVREIVRDIIQENRVLGPGKLSLEEHSTDHLLEENPLHSIAIEPQSPLTSPSEEFDFPINHNHCINEEPIIVSDEEQYTSKNIQGSQNGVIINGSLVDASDKDSDEFIQTELPVNEHKKIEDVLKEESGMPINHVTPLAVDVKVGTFPLDSFSWAANGSDVISETLISTDASEKKVSQTIELESDVSLFNSEDNNSTKASGRADEKAFSETMSDLVEVAQIVEVTNGTIMKDGRIHEVEGPGLEICTDTPISVTFEQGQKSSEIKAPNASLSGTKNLNDSRNNGIDQASKIKEETEVKNKVEAEQTGGSQKESIPTLNRLNLKSWHGTSKDYSKPENNPLLEILNAFIAAFVKFWSE
ncbi:uncharacterized protein LOC111487247 [Cucurbita maxima]|uniref:Uncharacterized protein LOC111487247 n=1 Tax=Cucurbita maxima TaxID=3661 RepID=A0A6J1JPX5_CUCMA|nr:uncharacterized protein LOC111487247 [Cucurbita maxima]XP_022990370.1 uncharacterized protein LOC111487247 [Cucurbita maxima]XP_022990371.1 uncharacterized protein LOC111487247 [Cucurbita maxima]